MTRVAPSSAERTKRLLWRKQLPRLDSPIKAVVKSSWAPTSLAMCSELLGIVF